MHPYDLLSGEIRIPRSRVSSPTKTYSSRFRTDQTKGLWAEDQVIAHMCDLGWQLRGRRKKLINGEVDLIFKKQKSYFFIEVKYLNSSWNIFERVTFDQKRKLIRNRVYYSLRFKEFNFLTAIAFVGPLISDPNNLNLIHLEE